MSSFSNDSILTGMFLLHCSTSGCGECICGEKESAVPQSHSVTTPSVPAVDSPTSIAAWPNVKDFEGKQ